MLGQRRRCRQRKPKFYARSSAKRFSSTMDPRHLAGSIGFFPAFGAQAPAISGLEAGKAGGGVAAWTDRCRAIRRTRGTPPPLDADGVRADIVPGPVWQQPMRWEPVVGRCRATAPDSEGSLNAERITGIVARDHSRGGSGEGRMHSTTRSACEVVGKPEFRSLSYSILANVAHIYARRTKLSMRLSAGRRAQGPFHGPSLLRACATK